MSNRIQIGDIKPLGWLKEELRENMEGCIGNLEELAPGVIRDHDIYGKDRIKADNSKAWNMTMADGELVEAAVAINPANITWWDSESQSNWRDGFVRSAIMLDDPKYLEATRAYLERILGTQDEDGYLGIYDEDARFQYNGKNGELWAQSSLFRGLLACYEGLKDETILEKVCRAADRIMKGYPKDSSHPFHLEKAGGGVGHGLTIIDSFTWLYEITGEQKYLDYAVWICEEAEVAPLDNKDMLAANISNPFYIFQGHGPHTYESMRNLITVAYEKEEYRPLLDMLLQKLPYYLTPAGGPIGDEMIKGRTADATITGYEFCSVQELLADYSLLAAKSGDMLWNERIEWLYFNAAEGMKHPSDSAITYCKQDNAYAAGEPNRPGIPSENCRWMYSPTHQKAAMCCVPNMGRITPYFIQSLLRMDEEGYVAAGYGPYVYQGTYKDVQVCIEQNTRYPMEMNTTFHIKTASPVSFALRLRLPSWAKRMTVNGKVYENPERTCGEIVLRQEWYDNKVELVFEPEVCIKNDFKHDAYVTCGPLLYVLPLPYSETIVKEMPVPGFYEKKYAPLNRELEEIKISAADTDAFEVLHRDEEEGWNALRISGVFKDSDNNKVKMELVPMARTILRKATFGRA